MFGISKPSAPSKGGILNGPDGCAMYFVIGTVFIPSTALVLLLWTIRDGLRAAFDRDFTQWVIVGCFAAPVALALVMALAAVLVARYRAMQAPATMQAPAPAVNVRVNGNGPTPEIITAPSRAIPNGAAVPRPRLPGDLPIEFGS